METLNDDLRRADPARHLRDDDLEEVLARADIPADGEPRRVWWKKRRIAIPLFVWAAAALTGGAIVTPLVLGVGDEWVDLDARIPVTYTTQSGISVSCEYGVYASSEDGRTPEAERVGEILATADWTGFGQEVYDHSLAHPIVPREGDVWTNDTPETRDTISFKLALTAVVTSRIPLELRAVGIAGTDTCAGPFR